MGRLRSLISGRGGRPWERSRERWRSARPDAGLTWGFEPSGEAFLERAAAHGAFGDGRAVLEIGPGYGRLLRSALEHGHPFASWVGLDLSQANVAHLRAEFDDGRVEFRHGDAESESVEPADTLLASLTFKHLYPTFEALLANLVPQLRPGAVVAFDLIEGSGSHFEDDDVTYVRRYERDEIAAILDRCGLGEPEFDTVRHHPELVRLLVVARRP